MGLWDIFDTIGDSIYCAKLDLETARLQKEIDKIDEELLTNRISASLEKDKRQEKWWEEVLEILRNYTVNTEKKVSFYSDKELTEEEREQVSSFVENMIECVDDFISKLKEYKSDEELYEYADLAYPEPSDYGNFEFDYPTKAKAKIACKEAVQSLVKDVKEGFEEEKEQIVSCAKDYYKGLEDTFEGFINEFLESYDDYISLECEAEAEEYISAQKSVFFNEEILREEMKQFNLNVVFDALVNKRFEDKVENLFGVKQYLSLCTYEEDEGEYCYHMDDVCNKIYREIDDFLRAEIKCFPGEVFKAYAITIVLYCDMLKNCLKEL